MTEKKTKKTVKPKRKAKKHPGGRPAKYRPEYAEQAEKACSLFGAEDAELAKFFGVTARSIQNWKLKHPEFFHSIKKGKDIYDTLIVEESLRRRALGCKVEDVHAQSNGGDGNKKKTISKTVKELPPDPTSCIFWLVNRSPVDPETGKKRWQHVNKIEHSGPDGGPIPTINATVTGEMSARDSQDVYNELIRGDKGKE